MRAHRSVRGAQVGDLGAALPVAVLLGVAQPLRRLGEPPVDLAPGEARVARLVAEAVAKEVLAKHPDLNVLVTMAGIMRIEDWHKPESFLASAEAVLTTNVLGPIRLIAAFIEHLQAQPDATIITVSSGLAFAPLKVTPSYNASKAAIHMLSESIRLQLADTTVKVVELEPPAVPTSLLPGQENSEYAMPLDEFVAEVVALLESQPDAKEIQVERVKFLRYGEARGDYDQVVETLNARPTPTGSSFGQPRRRVAQLRDDGAATTSGKRLSVT
ncbi:SDR family oxidoreductase [Micromonospora purpureochromogenes]|uniref:SDR family oxidoreductase n=1 Tax=Micromonospora purpureochromogenes TaxID=47872 RepID=UPI00211B8A50|nr:SDR family NAD(P)-dependent oxidoreductase [Micromonospora purpureochromogenes]